MEVAKTIAFGHSRDVSPSKEKRPQQFSKAEIEEKRPQVVKGENDLKNEEQTKEG